MADPTGIAYSETGLASEIRALVPSPSSDAPDVIRRQMEHTRAQMDSTIKAIGNRLSPENLIQEAKSSAREATIGRVKEMKNDANRKIEGMSTSVTQILSDNPLPVAIIGLGLGWLWLSERSKRETNHLGALDYGDGRQRYYDEFNREQPLDVVRERASTVATNVEQKAADVRDRVTDTIQDAGQTISDVAERTGEKVGETASRVGGAVSSTVNRVGETTEMIHSRASETADQARIEAERFRREAEWRSRRAAFKTKQSLQETMSGNPLSVGAVLVIAGAAVGAAIPVTEYENKLMGDTRDRLLDSAKVRATDAVERVHTVVEDMHRAVVSDGEDSNSHADGMIDDNLGENDNSF